MYDKHPPIPLDNLLTKPIKFYIVLYEKGIKTVNMKNILEIEGIAET